MTRRGLKSTSVSHGHTFPLPAEGTRKAIDRGRPLSERVRTNVAVWECCQIAAEGIAALLQDADVVSPAETDAFLLWAMTERFESLSAGVPFPMFSGANGGAVSPYQWAEDEGLAREQMPYLLWARDHIRQIAEIIEERTIPEVAERGHRWAILQLLLIAADQYASGQPFRLPTSSEIRAWPSFELHIPNGSTLASAQTIVSARASTDVNDKAAYAWARDARAWAGVKPSPHTNAGRHEGNRSYNEEQFLSKYPKAYKRCASDRARRTDPDRLPLQLDVANEMGISKSTFCHYLSDYRAAWPPRLPE